VAEYDWYITAVKALKEIRANIAFKKKQSEIKREDNIKTNLYLMLFSLIVSLLLSLYLSTVMNRMLKNYEMRLKDTNEKLVFQSRQALLGELLPMIAHQWRQPINKIASILALLRFGLPEKKLNYTEIDNRCQDIEENIEFMSETIDDFRTFYEPKENTSIVNLKELIEKSIEYVQGSIRKKDIQLYKVLDDIEYGLYANEFLQVMINLIKNAVDSLEKRGEINIKLLEKDKTIIISVEDNGIGIDISSLKKVFDPYYTTKEDSMGLGLYMTKIILEKHMKGKIEVERLTQGTKFIIYLGTVINSVSTPNLS
jgi:signal transduction histidine kinase